jgi:nucleoside-diphosphate-sugar epimerase
MKNILITGASGFIGSALAKRLVQDNYKVSVFLRKNSDIWRIKDIIDELDVYCVDLLDQISIEKSIKKINPNIILHIAAITNNICKKNTNKKPIVNLRLFSVYGPHDIKTKLIPSVIDGCLNNLKLKLSHPETIKDFIYIDDVVDVCCKFDELKNACGQILNVGTGTKSTIKNVVDNIFYLMNRETECVWAFQFNFNEMKECVADCSKINKYLNWKAKINIEHGLKKVIQEMGIY